MAIYFIAAIRSRRRNRSRRCRGSCKFFACKESAVSCSISPRVSALLPPFDLFRFRHNDGGSRFLSFDPFFLYPLFTSFAHIISPSFFALLFANHLASYSLFVSSPFSFFCCFHLTLSPCSVLFFFLPRTMHSVLFITLSCWLC